MARFVSEEKASAHPGDIHIRQLLGQYGLCTVERLCALCAALQPQNAPDCALAAQRARQLEADGVCCRVSQLDYFAVVPAYRAHGIGAQLLAQLPAQEGDAEAILIEAEMPEKAEDAAMAVRRLGFYARCGAWDTHYTEHLFDAWFRILVLDCPGCAPLAPEAVVEALADCYRRTISETEWQKYVQFYCPDGTKYC